MDFSLSFGHIVFLRNCRIVSFNRLLDRVPLPFPFFTESCSSTSILTSKSDNRFLSLLLLSKSTLLLLGLLSANNAVETCGDDILFIPHVMSAGPRKCAHLERCVLSTSLPAGSPALKFILRETCNGHERKKDQDLEHTTHSYGLLGTIGILKDAGRKPTYDFW